jgi:hypothetical protein
MVSEGSAEGGAGGDFSKGGRGLHASTIETLDEVAGEGSGSEGGEAVEAAAPKPAGKGRGRRKGKAKGKGLREGTGAEAGAGAGAGAGATGRASSARLGRPRPLSHGGGGASGAGGGTLSSVGTGGIAGGSRTPMNRRGEVLPTIHGGAGGAKGAARLRSGPHCIWFGGSGAPVSSRTVWCALAGREFEGIRPELTEEEVGRGHGVVWARVVVWEGAVGGRLAPYPPCAIVCPWCQSWQRLSRSVVLRGVLCPLSLPPSPLPDDRGPDCGAVCAQRVQHPGHVGAHGPLL